MLTDLGNGYTKGEYMIYRDVGKLNPKGKTRVFEIQNKNSGALLGHIKWYTYWRKYCFFPINSILDDECMLELVAFCRAKTADVKKTWKDTNNRFREKYDMTNRNKLKKHNVPTAELIQE